MRMLFLLAAFVSVSIFASEARAQGNYAEVTAEDVRSMTLNHYFVDRRSGGGSEDFNWVFTGDRFSIREAKAGIPADLIRRLLPEKSKAKSITGKWVVSEGKIVFTDIKFDGDNPGRKQAEYSIYRTAPTVIRIGEPQYVFAR